MTDSVTTAHLADACVRLGLELRPVRLRPAFPGAAVDGPAVPIRHLGSVDVILEAIDDVEPNDVLVIDDEGRTDRACMGDLVAIEALSAGAGGIVVNGCHRDTAELAELGLGVFSIGANPAGPTSIEAAPGTVRIGHHDVSHRDWIVGDADGVLVLPAARIDELKIVAAEIRDVEHRQAAAVRAGTSLRQQLRFDEYRQRRELDADYRFREHLISLGAAIEA